MTESVKALPWPRGSVAMPFQNYATFFEPEEIETLTAAYDLAWRRLHDASVVMNPEQASELKRRLSQVILASACAGERDAECLREIALRAVARPRRTKEPKH
jgi:hypothetical protein